MVILYRAREVLSIEGEISRRETRPAGRRVSEEKSPRGAFFRSDTPRKGEMKRNCVPRAFRLFARGVGGTRREQDPTLRPRDAKVNMGNKPRGGADRRNEGSAGACPRPTGNRAGREGKKHGEGAGRGNSGSKRHPFLLHPRPIKRFFVSLRERAGALSSASLKGAFLAIFNFSVCMVLFTLQSI